MRAVLAGAAAVAALVTACGSEPSAPEIVLDGSPRRSNAEGVVVEVDSEHLVLDGDRRYSIHPELQCFDATNLKAIPVVNRKGTYVQLGVAGSTVRWLAGYSAVFDLPDKPRTAFHVGTITSTTESEVVFKDGSVLTLAEGVERLPPGTPARADIDVDRHQVTLLARS